jgi:hypothetical protein
MVNAQILSMNGVCIEVNANKTKHMVMSRDQNEGQNIKNNNSSFERVEQFKYLGKTLMNQNPIQEEIKSRLKSGRLAIIRCRISCLPVCYPNI